MPDNSVLIFDPEGVNIGEYRSKYPELRRIKEFAGITDFELVWVWYYSNPTSFFVYRYPKKRERVEAVCKKMYSNEDGAKDFMDKFLGRTLLNQEDIDLAIDRMARIVPDARREAKDMVDKIFSDYKDLLSLPIESYKKRDGETDFSNYLAVRKTITKDLDDIIERVEQGFGMNKMGEITSDGQANLEEYHKNKLRK